MSNTAGLLYRLQESNLYAAAQEIDYLDNVIQEILRLHPPAPEYVIWPHPQGLSKIMRYF